MSNRKRILLIEPNDLHYELVRETVANSPLPLLLTRASNLERGLQVLKGRKFDLVLTEFFQTIPGKKNGFALLKDQTRGAPIVILTTENDESKAVESMKMGAFDYLVKNRETLKNLPKAIGRFSEKKHISKTEATPITQSGPLRRLSKNLSLITELINNPQASIARGRKQIQVLEKELENLKGVIRGWLK